MADTCLDIVTRALRMSRVVPVGRSPKPAETEEGLAALQSLYDGWRTGGLFGTLEDVYLGGSPAGGLLVTDGDGSLLLAGDEFDANTSAVAQEGKRYYVPDGFTLTDATNEYADECGRVRQPRDLAMYEVVLADGTQNAKLYDRTGWVDLLDLAPTDPAPMAGHGAYGLAAVLATYGGFVATFGVQPQEATVALAKSFMRNVMGKAGSTQDNSGAEFF